MRMSMKLAAVAAVLLALLAAGPSAFAALAEKPVMDGINDNIAVLRFYHRQVADAQANLDLVHAALDLTQRQYDAQKNLFDTEVAKNGPPEKNERAKFYFNRLRQLERQLGKLKQYDFDKIFGTRIADAKAAIEKYSMDLEARMTEYEVLFGKKAKVEIGFEKEMQRYKPKRADAASFLNLD